MKRPVLVAMSVASAALLSLSACSSSGGSSGNASGGGAATNVAAGKGGGGGSHKFTFVQGVAGDGFYVTMACGIKAEANKLGGISVNTQGPAKFDATLQNPIIQSVTAAKPDALLIAPDDVSASQIPLDQAVQAGIKLVLVDTSLKDPSKAISQISSDNLAGGQQAFTAIKQLAPQGGKVLVVNTQPGISTTDQRTQGFASAAKADSKYTYVGVQYDQDSAQVAAQVTSASLQKNPDIVGIFATNLFSAEGAATAVRQAGKQGKVKIVGFDADPDQISALKSGTVQALIAQQPYQIGVDAVQQAYNAIKGKSVTKKIGTKFAIITQANISSAASQAAIYKTKC